MKQSKQKWLVPFPLIMALKNQRRHMNADCNEKIKFFFNILKELKKIDRLILWESNYIECLRLGLYLEQYQQLTELKQFSLICTEIEKIPAKDVKNKFRIKIQNVNEHNPILNVSDSLEVYKCGVEDAETYYLKVARLQKAHVIVIANKAFCNKYSPKALYNVKLVFNDFTFQSGHLVLSKASLKSVMTHIFPLKSAQICSSPENNNERCWFNSTISNNPEQKQAVLNICGKSSFPAPYILYGPPGTGKTATIVEAVCQIWKDTAEVTNAAKHILICAPSNAACDVVAKRILAFIKFNNVYRIYSQGKDYSTISPELKRCCNYDYEGFAEELNNFQFESRRIIITTLSSSAKLVKLKLNVKLSHIFIDEAGQATQPDALLPVYLIQVTESDKCQIVMSGDPQQLGPCIRSKLAETILGESILEKLMDQKPYEKVKGTGYDPNYITKLIRNYRSGADIIHVSNKLFYDNELIACNEKIDAKFPVIFHAVKGTEKKVYSSTSSYNQEEINRVIQYVEHFLNRKVGGKERFKKKDIGIVTPFALQSLKLRKELDKKKLSSVDVGTVEIFQGQEKEIIIVSTVRSKTFHHGKSEHIGFLSNPRRFNVALTRPKTFLVVVGNPDVLQVGRCWKYFLKFCKENKACRGYDFKLKEDDVDVLLANMNLGIKSKRSDVLFGQRLRFI